MLVAGYGATEEATSALPQLTVQHCAALCRLPGDWRPDTEKGMQNHPILPTEQNYLHLTHPRWWVTCLLWILQKTTKFHQREGNSFGKETGFAVRCCLTRLSGKEIFPSTKGMQSHFHCLAKSKDSKQTGLSRHKHEQLHWVLITIHIFGPPARLGAVSGGVNHSMSSQWKVLPV